MSGPTFADNRPKVFFIDNFHNHFKENLYIAELQSLQLSNIVIRAKIVSLMLL